MEKYCNGINKNSAELLVRGFNRYYKNLFDAYFSIDLFTLGENKVEDWEDFSYDKKTQQYEYNDNGISIKFKKLSDVIRANCYKEDLFTSDRKNKCAEKTYELCPYIPDSKLIAGYTFVGAKKELHLVIEWNDSFIDWNLNAIIPKEDYFKLTKFQVISELSVDKIIEDKEKRVMEELCNDYCSLHLYVIFRDEIMADLEKNKQITKKQTIF